MKLTRKKAVKKTPVAVKKKQSFDFKQFWNSVNSLNGQNYGTAPLPVKLFILAMLMALILALAYFLLVNKKREEIAQAEAEQVTLLKTYQEKESKARHLDVYKEQVAQMEVEFSELLNQLPKDTRVSELIDGINMVGAGSGLRFQNITVQDEIEQEFFIEQPITITGIGEYHQFGNFVSGVAALPRIITMHDFEVKNQQPSLSVMPQLQMVLQTKTYRSKEAVEENAEASATPAEGASQ